MYSGFIGGYLNCFICCFIYFTGHLVQQKDAQEKTFLDVEVKIHTVNLLILGM